MKDLGIFKAAVLLLAVSAAGCGMPGGTPSAGPLSSVTGQAAAPVGASREASPLGFRHKPIAGKYNGSIQWTKAGTTYSGTLETNLVFNNKNILSPFKITVNGKKYPYRFYGRIKSKTKASTVIVFLVYNTHGGYATGAATIANDTFVGKAHSPAGGNGPTNVSMSFSMTRN